MIPGLQVPGLELATQIGPGFTPSSSASSGPQRSGDVGGGNLFGGINTGTQSGIPSWVTVALIGMAAVGFVLLMRRR